MKKIMTALSLLLLIVVAGCTSSVVTEKNVQVTEQPAGSESEEFFFTDESEWIELGTFS